MEPTRYKLGMAKVQRNDILVWEQRLVEAVEHKLVEVVEEGGCKKACKKAF